MTQQHSFCLTRAYVVLGSSARDLLAVFDLLVSATHGRAVRAEVNYGRQGEVEGARQRLGTLAGPPAEQVLAIDGKGQLAFAVLKEPLEGPGCYQLIATWEPGHDFGAAADFLARLPSVGHVAYGYARTAPANLSPLTEAPIRKRWFGRSTVVPKRRDGWISPSTTVLEGGVRGLYPLNVWRPQVHAELKAQGVRLPSRLDGAEGLIQLDPASAQEIRTINEGDLPWLHA